MNRLLFLASMFFLIACSNSTQEETKEEVPVLPPQYYYYPKANVYFDSANKEYIFQSIDSLNWQSARQIPAVVLAMMDKTILIQNPSDPVWKDNETHRLVYSAVLYATPGDTTAKKKVVKPVKKSLEFPVEDSSATVEKKEKKGLGKLLDKIFGGNKKKKEEKQESSGQN
jgi:hypothetical protein